MKKSCPSFNDLRKSETLEKAGTITKIALAAALAGPVLTHEKGSLFSMAPSHEVTRTIASEPAHEREDDDAGKHEAVTHKVSEKRYTIRHEVKEKAASVKSKLTAIRNQIKEME